MAEQNFDIDNLLLSFLKEEISEKEKAILMDWLAESEDNKKYFQHIYKVWSASELTKTNHEENLVLQKLKYAIKSQEIINLDDSENRFRIGSLAKYAAVALISLITGALAYSLFSGTDLKNAYHEVAVPMGSKSTIHLPDGSEVTLNAGSKIVYGLEYGKKLREVTLVGEGYFKVAKQKEKPFIVHTANADIKALGTEFNVKAYPEENVVETILVEGSVAVNAVNIESRLQENLKEVILTPGQKLQIFKKEADVAQMQERAKETQTIPLEKIQKNTPVVVAETDIKVETSWKDKRWTIQGVDLETLAVLLSRKFNVDIRLKDAELRKYKFTGTIENETVEQVFEIMKYTVPISYTIEKGKVTWTINRNLEKDYNEAY